MSSPLFSAFGGMQSGGKNPFAIVQEFIRFKNEMSGKNPNEEINRLLQSGQVTQQQLNELQGTANQMGGLLQQFMNIKSK